jgi:hypothetical protein
MKQYIDKAAVVAEIERRIDEVNQIDKASYEVGLFDAYKIILSFLDTLEVKEIGVDLGDPQGDIGVKWVQEEPVSNDLEAEFVFYLKHKFNIPQEGHKLKTNGWRPSPYDLLDIAKHFAQWQKEQILGDDNKQYHRLRHETLKRLYENEAKLKLMLDNALEGYIEKYEQIGGHNYLSLKIPMLSKPDDCKDDEKVKLIIIKEE